jgi:hypothetical protein
MEQRRATDRKNIDRRHLLMTTFMVGALISATALLALGAFWWFYPYKTITKSPMPMPIVKGYETVRQGGVLLYEYDFVKYTDVVPVVQRQFVDGLIFESTDVTTNLKIGTGHTFVVVPIPTELPPGVYHIQVIAEFHMNPLKTITNVTETQTFTVLPMLDHPDKSQDASETP